MRVERVDGDLIANCYAEADAALIVRAVNAHDALVEILGRAKQCIGDCADPYGELAAEIDSVLKLARGES